jgi:hypothetical protein
MTQLLLRNLRNNNQRVLKLEVEEKSADQHTVGMPLLSPRPAAKAERG